MIKTVTLKNHRDLAKGRTYIRNRIVQPPVIGA